MIASSETDGHGTTEATAQGLRAVLYFAYGSDMSTAQMRARCPLSMPVGLAQLSGWRWTMSGSGCATIEPTDDGNGPGVYGILYLLSTQDEASLDRMQGAPRAYDKRMLGVGWPAVARGGATSVSALVYVCCGGAARQHGEGGEYLARLRGGVEDAVEEWGMPREYADELIARMNVAS